MRRILCLYLSNWPIQRLLAERRVGSAHQADLVGRAHPTILHSRDPRRGEVIVVCNQAAYERGVRPEMPLAEAAALLQHSSHQPDAQARICIQPHDAAADLAALARLAEYCERFSPIVGWETVDGHGSEFKVGCFRGLNFELFIFRRHRHRRALRRGRIAGPRSHR